MTFMMQRRLLLVLAIINGSVCIAAGLSYLAVSPTELNIAGLVAAGVLGGVGLIAAGIWANKDAATKPLPRLVLGILAGGFALASALGLWGAQVARSLRLEPTGVPSALHVVGVILGVALAIAVLKRPLTHRLESHS